MDRDAIMNKIEDEDFVIRVRPFANDSGGWDGEIDLTILTLPANPLSDDDYSQVMHLVKMMCATVPVMEQVKELRDLVDEYVEKIIDNDNDIDVELEEECGVEKTYDGNVIHLNFNTKTGGSA